MVSLKQLSLFAASFGTMIVPTHATFIFQYCVDPNFQNCHDICGVPGQCIPVPTGLSSARAAPGHNCYIYNENTGCVGNRGGPVTSDDRHYNLGIYGWNEITMSVKCELA
ncbi:hypothetical protein NUW58_g5387 [Xylaria curta]|uniref:Uncharacterized protein n=1 Tax=Xylaria curta TaxID=42375 RepID=A0ACC1P1U7_9PEZI|nr:hypothetical protein NUW58_g5387 [Xylaria curta]